MKIDEIHLGNCMDIMAEMRDDSVDLTLTDIPYDECNKESGGLREIDKGSADRLNFDLPDFLTQVERVTRGSIYIFCGIQQVSTIYRKFREDGLITRHCVWQKTNPSPMNGRFTWISAIENCIFAKFPNAAFNEFCNPNVWKCKAGESVRHPTEKPMELFLRLIEASSRKKDVVFDPCLGSGTTALACIHTKRHFVGVEIDAEWYKLARRRVNRAIESDIDALQNRNSREFK